VLPWNYGFEWNTGHIIFLGAFYTVLVIVATTVVNALIRARRDLRARQVESIRWHSEFGDLPVSDRVCRHVLNGEFRERTCPHAFDCRECETHAKWIEKHAIAQNPEFEEEVLGMSFPLDRFYHRGHTWARPEDDGTVTIGLDELGKRLIGSPGIVDLPAPGTHIVANGTAFRVHKRDADVRILAPLDGEVVETGGPERGWYLRIKPLAAGEPAFRHLLRGSEVKAWLSRELERLQLALVAEGATPTLADGGVPVDDIAACYPDADWDAVCGEMFLQ